ncbi:Cellobiose phosphorylase [Fervidobacterium changbaicum]|uniref:Glycosyl transferase family 36 n=1 Tax=Fervidobacterium changbaicum TaxID=310769 RepID=A0ABX5QQE3_9BACT|nr:glycosyl transferase family 36 [Fervidobacterium changbaicum]QAV32634.1 glycosyl transferase family 36 [Fervidobacterium changbaicum]SDH35734.1 Cellobiose phosphorylase [Fervidobacterium changbaicum]
MKLFESKYGYFTSDGKEYVITNPRTPRPWVNVISNGDYSIIASHTGSGYSWRGNAGQNRITRLYQDLIKDNWGKYVYIRDTESGKFWSAGWKPVMAEYQSYEVVHGIGYTVYRHKVDDIYSEMKVFVSIDAPIEFMYIIVRNDANKTRKLDLTTYFEWVLGNFPDEHREFHKLFFDPTFKNNTIFVKKYLGQFPDEKGRWNNTSWDHIAFHSVSLATKSFTCDKESFIGMYGDERNPIAMKLEKLDNKCDRFGDACSSLQVEITLNPGEEKKVVFTIGAAKIGEEDPNLLAEKYTNVEIAEQEFEKVRKFWMDLLERELVETPDDGLNIMTNYWAKYQAISGRIWAKSGYYQVSAGYGFRDQLQDSQIFFSLRPELAKKQILLHAEHQFQEGDVLHWWFTIRGGGPRTHCSDDLLWLPFIIQEYIKETMDYSILDEVVPYVDGGKGTIYEHCKKAIEKAFKRFSPRGLPLIGENDWNDGMNAVGTDWKGESIWLAHFMYLLLKEFIPLMELKGDSKFAAKCKDVLEVLRDSVNKYAWDGEWFIRATKDDGEKLGSKENEEGFIFLNAQTWAVISDITDEERKRKAMESVKKYLLKDFGALLLYPAYTKPRSDIGYITRYAPGLRENGGVYTHAATWAVWAFALMRDVEAMYKAYKGICPPYRSFDIDNYWAEPYVTCGNSDGPISPHYGRGGWTWYTGSAQWLHRVATHWILGIRPNYGYLDIDPVIPADWDGFTYKRFFGDTLYTVVVKNPNKVSNGVKEIVFDGQKVQRVPILSDGRSHTVEVTLG